MPPNLRATRHPPLGETPLQTLLRHAARAIPKTWVETDPERNTDSGPLQTRGLYNANVLCYRNGLLQGLMHQPAFARWVRWHHDTTCAILDSKICVACALYDLMIRYWDRRSLSHAPFRAQLSQLQNTLINAGWQNRRGATRQEDPEELYNLVINTLIAQQPNETDMLNGLFMLHIKETLTCTTCGDVQVQTHPDETMKVGFPESAAASRYLSLVQMIKDSTFLPEPLQDINCEPCGHRTVKEVRRSIEAAPDALLIQLVRWYRFGGEAGVTVKRRESVYYPKRLNLTQYYNHLPDTPKIPLLYELVGVQKHSGDWTDGHYLGDFKQPNKRWMHANDATIRPSTEQEARSDWVKDRKKALFTPYLLFYKRILQYAD